MHRRRNQSAAFCFVVFLIPAILLRPAFAGTIERSLARAWVTHCKATQAQPIIGEDPLVDIEIPDPILGCFFVDSYIGGVTAEGRSIIRRAGVAGPIIEIIFDATVVDGRRLWAVADWAAVENYTEGGAEYEMVSRLAFLEDDRPVRYSIAFMRNAAELTWAESFETGEALIVLNPDTTTMIRVARSLGSETIIFNLDYR